MEKDRSVLPVVLIRGHAVISAVVVWLTVGSAFSPIILPVSAAEPPVETSREKKLDPATLEFVTEKVQPLLATRCLKCHSGDKDDLKGNLSLNSRAAMLAGGDSGPSIVPGAPDKSLLIDAINWRGDYEMPAKSRMPPGEIAILTRWVKMGAPWSDAGKAAVVTHSSFPLESRRAEHWAWQPIGHHEPPKTENSDWPLRGVDHFVLAGLEAAGLTIAPAAERSVLLRRVYFDLIGLPPTPNEVTEFLEDKMPTRQALAAVADRLLESSHFGERWARHWLDLMRYAESRGHEFDHTAPNAHHYRDYVIRAINADLPYNRFVTEHVAGDLLDPPRLHPEHGFNESVLATGAWYLGEWIHSPTDIRQDEADRIDGVIDTVGKAFLGITIACARCHDHKFDAISARDYYGLAGYLQSSRYRQVRFDSMVHNQWVADSLWKLRKQHETDLRTRLAASTKQAVDHWADYLLAARELVAKERSAGNLQEDASFVGAVATAHKLDAGNLKRLVGHLKSVKEQPSDPLHLWALAACENGATDNNAALAAIRHAAEQIRTEDSGSSDFWNEIRIVVDYSTLAAGQWNQDGYAFGSGPQRPGDIRLISDSDGNLVSIATSGAARRDLLWKGLNLAEGTQTEPGALGSLQRSGQTLCTPTFSIESGTLQYLIRGTAKVQAVVDSHRLIAGPLHGGLIRTVKAGSTLKWVSHPLDRYVGHRAHLEFVPEGDEDFELLMVADSKSRLPLPQPIRICAQVAMGETTENVRSLAIALQELFGATHRGLADGSLMEPGQAQLADWIVRNRSLFVSDDSLDQQLAELATQYQQEEAALAGQIQRDSRTAMAIADAAGEDESLLIRGRSNMPGELVPRRFLEAVVGAQAAHRDHGSGRLELAEQMVDVQRNPLIARVYVNRIWQHLLGRGIVPTPDNFGVLGRPPSHPELLDYLAETFVADGWSTKNLVRRIVNSGTYQMSSTLQDDHAEATDPDNILLHRMSVRRLEGEVIRDAILAVSGRLDRQLEGSPVPVHLTAFMTGRGRPKESGPLDGAGRRSIYTSVRRNFLSPMMLAFDVPIPTQPVGRRNVSNVPSQALILLNDPFVRQQGEIWAQKVLENQQRTPEERIVNMYESAFARSPTEAELADSLSFLKSQADLTGLDANQWQRDSVVWADLGHILWNTKEFIFID